MPNEIPERYCFSYYFDYNGPTASMYYPGDTYITSCNQCSLYFSITDYTEVDEESIVLTIAGETYTTASPEVSYDGYVLIFSPDFDWEEGTMISVVLESADDIYGNHLLGAPRIFTFGIDTTAPSVEVISPSEGEIIYTYSPMITFKLLDDFSGIYHGSFPIRVNGDRFTLSDPGFSLVDSMLQINLDEAGIVLPSGSTTVCIDSVSDSAILCGPNTSGISCLTFYVSEDDGGPDAWLRSPLDGSYSSCEHDSIILVFRDTDGINWPSLVVNINGYIHSYGSSSVEVLSDTSVCIIPTVSAVDGDTIFVTLESITDIHENITSYDEPWFFITDRASPYAELLSPLEGTVFGSSGEIVVLLQDDGAGVETSSIYFTSSAGDSIGIDALIDSGDSLILDITSLTFADSIEICLHSSDLTLYCGVNVMVPTCWSFYIDISPPGIEFVLPEMASYTSCPYQEIVIHSEDLWGIDPLSIDFSVDGIDITPSDLIFENDTFTYTPSSSLSSGDTIYAHLNGLSDTIGNVFEGSIETWFIVDLDPPIIGIETPITASVSANISQIMSVEISDSLSGVDPTSLIFLLNGTEYSLDSPAFTYSSNLLTFNPLDISLEFSEGDTVHWCVFGSDNASSYCPANSTDSTCFFFTINTSGPFAEVISPLERSYYACHPDSAEIIMELSDEDGIDPSSIRFFVDGILAELGLNLFYEAPYLIYRPIDVLPESGWQA